MVVITVSPETCEAFKQAVKNGEIESLAPERVLPGSELGKRIEAASTVWDYLNNGNKETPAEVIDAYEEICERLKIPYVIVRCD